jgi:hypothetical protein
VVSRRRTRVARRARERGAAVFIVVLVLAMLTAIGVFAAGSASLSTTASGYERQMTQTRYLTEYALSLVLADLEAAGGLSEVEAARKAALLAGSPPTCTGNPQLCFIVVPPTLQNKALQPLVEPPAAGAPGGLGFADAGWNFKVELTDWFRSGMPPAGNDYSNSKSVNITFCTVTLNARGLIWPRPVGADGPAIGAAGSQSALSTHVTLPCPPP